MGTKRLSTNERVLKTLREKGPRSVTQLLADIGPHIPNAQAANHGRRLIAKRRSASPRHYVNPASVEKLIEQGKRRMLASALGDLKRRGLIQHIGEALYQVAK